MWSRDVGFHYKTPNNFVDEVLLAFIFPEHLGGCPDVCFPNDAIIFPQSNIPVDWLPFAESGAVRLQTIDNAFCRLWKPYYFLLKWMQRRITIFEFSDVEQLRSEIQCGNIAPDKRKGYCFQRAGIFFSWNLKYITNYLSSLVALELVHMSSSNFWKLMIKKISDLGVKVSPQLLAR